MRYLDASVPLCVMTGEPAEHYQRCVEIMERVGEGKEKTSTSVFTVAETDHILKRGKLGRDERARKLKSLLDCSGLKVLDIEAILCRDALELAHTYEVDFVDAHNVLTMKRNGIKEIYSLDEHYDMFDGIQRVF